MKREPVDKHFGIPMSEWIARIPNELEVDAVGLWQIVPVGRDSFGLSGELLVDFTRRCLIALLERGARPVKGAVDGGGWVLIDWPSCSDEELSDLIISDWQKSGIDPDVNGIWLTLMK